MRLLNTTTIELSEFFGAKIPPYAILSHRWTDCEVTFQELQSGNGPQSSGWGKLTGCCTRAKKDGYNFVWIDSCCIDKSSSAELSEAINSMFRWYQSSEVCYAYLVDVTAQRTDYDRAKFDSEFKQSKWFTRGWTLQELLAPENLIFFNRDWIDVGTKLYLQNLICSITRIDHLFHFEGASIAQKMSWVSGRETLRPEDMAYCMLGIFGVNMPLLYGEGEKAFLRLQIEIMRISDDESIFAWTDPTIGESMTGLLAQSPTAFKNSGDIEQLPSTRAAPYLMTNKGLQIELTLCTPRPKHLSESQLMEDILGRFRREESSETPSTFIAPLCCARENSFSPLAIQLVELSRQTNEFARTSYHTFANLEAQSFRERTVTIFVRQSKKFTMHRGADLIHLQGLHNISLSPSSAAFYPGHFLSHQFIAQNKEDVYHSVTAIDLKEISPNGRNLAVKLGYGLTLVTLQLAFPSARDKTCVLEIVVPQEGAPCIDILLAYDSKEMQKLIHEKLTQKKKIACSSPVLRKLGPGLNVLVSILRQRQGGIFSYIVDVGIQAEALPISIQKSSNNRF